MSEPIAQENKDKKHVTMTPEVASLFNLPPTDIYGQPLGVPLSQLPVKDLPVEPVHEAPHAPEPATKPGAFSKIVGNLYIKGQEPVEAKIHSSDLAHDAIMEDVKAAAGNPNIALKILKSVVPYLIIFTLAVFVYFFFFSGVNISDYFHSASASPSTPKETALQQVESQSLAGYQTWIQQFYFDVTDSKLIDPDSDNSGNGLTNFQKYLLNLNPKSYDTLGLGMADSEALERGINPLSGAPLNDSQKQIIDKYFDMEVISNRLTLEQLQKNSGSVAGASVTASGSGAQTTPVVAPTVTQTSSPNPPGEGTPDNLALGLDINTGVPGRLEIPSLKVNAPLMWTSNTNNFDTDLQSGVVHYPGTALPGQIGTAYISGHSSNYVWAKGDFNHVFTHLGDLANDTSFKITVVQKNGKDAILHYVVVGRQQYDPKDQAQFVNTGKSVVALSTCWPVGSTAKRLVVFGQLTQVEK